MSWKKLLFIALIIYGAHHAWEKRQVTHHAGFASHAASSAGGSVANEPLQQDLDDSQTVSMNGYQLSMLAKFSINARVLSREDYSFGREADLSPVDLALGWGRMAEDAVLSNISISQSNRFYFWQTDNLPIPREEIETHSANMHLIPADKAVKEALEDVRVGHIVHIEGYLVEAKASDGWHWRSSLTREDTGDGACEVILVKSVSVR